MTSRRRVHGLLPMTRDEYKWLPSPTDRQVHQKHKGKKLQEELLALEQGEAQVVAEGDEDRLSESFCYVISP